MRATSNSITPPIDDELRPASGDEETKVPHHTKLEESQSCFRCHIALVLGADLELVVTAFSVLGL